VVALLKCLGNKNKRSHKSRTFHFMREGKKEKNDNKKKKIETLKIHASQLPVLTRGQIIASFFLSYDL